ncbi:DNA-binding transcriptional LysR family regulator [Vibrio crassostreae]|nr:LysR family transcriptional regulator [Vibrio crassostreae]TCN91227.1 DNA-binding transcriptional LysR family regulator [Vibrio crassostreae]CAK2059646.1 DNA-binding transcriptional LysR family regulator [Vibrio crassostreae]CAK2845338.1 DNA-binding transcriptional LysR family regulator [Vibrio crassostreae]CAK2884424.1 DNA-binding transcriptional LysR family regulator [Vibrio crassostreae]CAK2931005.1 DNA-binding transcriptional LysR family regulator [Vibrio crassostreae]
MVTLEQQLSRLDLNLLVSLSVLIKEKNVTRAAQKLYLSQPAMSRMLGKLRDIFDDPLFYRESNGLKPTQKALDLQIPLEELLRAAQLLIEKSAFTPAKCDNTFVISIPPLMSSFLSVPLASSLIQQAPLASLAEFPAAKEPTQQLAARDVEFSIHISEPNDCIEFPYEKVGTTYPVFYVSTQHPLASKQGVTLEDVLKYRFVDMSLDIRSSFGLSNPIDGYLAQKGLVRDIVYKSGQIFSLIELMQHSDTVMVSSHKLGSLSQVRDKLVPVLVLDGIDELNLDIYLIEHKRTSTSEAHIWFRELIITTIREKIFGD